MKKDKQPVNRKYTKRALLFIEIQNDYFYKVKMELEGSYEAGYKAKRVLEIFRKKRKPVVHTTPTFL
jgi:nicotinamidase-related amidase